MNDGCAAKEVQAVAGLAGAGPSRDVTLRTAALEALQIGVVVHDADTRVIFCNPSAALYMGLTVEQMVGRDALDPHWQLLDAHGQAMAVEDYPVMRAVRTAEPVIDALLGVHHGSQPGQIRWLLVNANPVKLADGTLDFVVVNFADITSRRRMELALQGEQNMLRVMLRNASDGMCIINEQGCVEEASKSWEQHLGCTHAQALGMHISEWEAHHDRPSVDAIIAKVLAGRQRVQFDSFHRRRSGEVVDVEVSAVPFEYGGRMLIFCLTRNVVAHKANLAALARSNEALEQLVSARTADLSAALAAAQDANRAKDFFLSSMSHELRTPLHAVLGYAQLLLEADASALPQVQRKQVQQIEASAEHLLQLVGDLLDLARIEMGQLEMHVQSIDVCLAIEKVLAVAAPMAERMGVALSLAPHAADLWAQGDPVRFHQCLTNLVTNAIKYNRAGGRVRLEARWQSDGGGDGVIVDVTDTGRGLSLAQQAELFERFNRLGAEQSGIEGCGIGLAITAGLMARMQGRITVVSQPGVGSTFSLWLPVSGTRGAPHEAPGEKTPAPLTDLHGADALRVLYIEDNEVNLALMQGMVALRPGVSLAVARSGAEALSSLKTQGADLVLVDMNLGDCHGIDLLRTLQREVADPARAHVAVSADASRDQIALALAQGFDAYITKPVRLREILSTLDDFKQRLALRQRATTALAAKAEP